MNLLKDVRDESWVPVAEKPQVTPPHIDEVEEDETLDLFDREPQRSTVTEEAAMDWNYGRPKRSFAKPFMTTFIVLIAIVAAGYFGYKYFFAEQGRVIQETTEQEGIAGQGQPQLAKPESARTEQPSAPAEQQPSGTRPSQSGILSTSGNMSHIVGVLSPNIRLLTLILDETSLSTEIAASSSQDVESFYQTLKSQISGDFSITSTSTIGPEVRALISGTTSTATAELRVSQSPLVTGEFSSTVRTMAAEAGTRVADFTVGNPFSSGRYRKTPIFIKLNGSMQACSSFFNALSARFADLQVSKVILLAQPDGTANLVLRVLMNQNM
jgi:hypothetical protein